MDYSNMKVVSEVIRGNWSFKGLDEYDSDDALAAVPLLRGYPDPLQQFAFTFCVIFAIIGILGNLITIIALARYKKVRNPTAIFIINLSTSDLMFCCFILPLSAIIFKSRAWVLGKTLCRVFPLLKYSLNAISLFTIMAITINRYILIAHARYYLKLYHKRNLMIMVINIWLWASGIFTPILFEKWGRFSLDPDEAVCSIIPDHNKQSPKMFLCIISFLIPCVVIFLCYGRILWVVRNTKANASKPNDAPLSSAENRRSTQEIEMFIDRASNEIVEDMEIDNVKANDTLRKFGKKFRSTVKRVKGPTKRDQKLRTMIAAIMVSFFVCHLPAMLAKTIYSKLSSHPYGHMTAYLLKYMTTSVNPIIYVVMSSEYRQAYNNLWRSYTPNKGHK